MRMRINKKEKNNSQPNGVAFFFCLQNRVAFDDIGLPINHPLYIHLRIFKMNNTHEISKWNWKEKLHVAM